MKTSAAVLCLAVLVSACSPTPADPTRAAVTAYLRKTLDDPASYQPVRFGAVTPWLQRGADSLAAGAKALAMQADYAHAQSFIDSCNSGEMFADEDTTRQGMSKRSGVAAGQRSDENLIQLKRLQSSADTTRLGSVFWHSFRAKNKLGALVLDSARFVVSTTGTVRVLH